MSRKVGARSSSKAKPWRSRRHSCTTSTVRIQRQGERWVPAPTPVQCPDPDPGRAPIIHGPEHVRFGVGVRAGVGVTEWGWG